MQFKPSEITEVHVRKGLEKIKNSDKPLTNGTRWEVVIDGKSYPPKEVMRFAREQYDGSKDWPKGGGWPTNDFLEKMGFEVKEINSNREEQLNSVPYFNIPGIWNYQKVSGTNYDSSTEAANWYYDTRGKLYYLITLISEYFNEEFELVYHEKPNAQKGRGKILFKDYVLAGFAPKEKNIGDHLFIKISFTNLKLKPHFALDLDMNFREGKSIFQKERGNIYSNSLIEWGIDNSFPGNWNDLLKLISPEIKKLNNQFKIMTGNFSTVKSNEVKMNLNQILYGPPGTGKTYNTINKALEIINDSEVLVLDWNDRTKVKELFDKKIKEGQIVFTTFHQNMSYEDFIEGIKPVTVNNNVIYNIEDGVFKKLCGKASEKKSSKNFDDSYANFVDEVLTNGSIILETPVHKKKFRVVINSNETAVAIPETEKGTNMGVTKEMSRDYIVNGVIRDWKPYTTSIGEYIKEKYPVDIENIDNSNKKFVIIIDEINRGNVSKIFGELITLIEESKRTGKSEAITATLPYSKKEFSVPDNVYILGTMNTADRSVETLDTALRRRFDFIEMMPKYDLYKRSEMNYFLNGMFVFDILETINNRLEVLLGRDYLIGHSFFILDEQESIEPKVESAFYKNIIPLLQEYFYGDYNKIGLVLGSGFLKKTPVVKAKELFADDKKFGGDDYVNNTYSFEIVDYTDKNLYHNNTEFYSALDTLMNKKNASETNE